MSVYIDGNYTTAFLTSNVVSYPYIWPNNSTVAVFDLEYIQTAAAYSAANLSSNSADAPSAYLVEQGPVTKIAPGLVKFRRTYSQLPATWTETQQMAYTFPGKSGPPAPSTTSFNPYYYRAPVTLYAIATLVHTYSQGATSPTLDAAFQVTDGGNVVDYIGYQNPNIGAGLTSPTAEPATYTVSSSAQLIRGLIWEKVTATVPKPV